MKNYIVEFIGTFFLVLVIGLTTNDPQLWAAGGTPFAPVAIGSMLMAMVYMGGPVSGAHFNPAVTLAVWIRKKMATRDVVPYMLSQIMGALCAALLYFFIFKRSMGGPVPMEGFTYNVKPFLVEAVFSFALITVVLHVMTSKKAANNSYFGLAIGFTFMAAVFAGGRISGGAFNPAIGIGPLVIHAILGGGNLLNLWIYIVGPGAGAVSAAMVYGLVTRDEREKV